MDQSDVNAELIEGWALGYLGRYASSTENLRRVLLRRVRRRLPAGSAAAQRALPLIDAVIERYRRSGLLDDDAYAARRSESLHRRGESLAKIRARLLAKGISGPVATAALSALRSGAADPDIAAACAFARRRRLGPYRSDATDLARQLAAFARAGFSRRVAEAVLACADVEAIEALANDGFG